MTIQLRYAAFSDVGLIRKSNQDAGYASAHLLVLADGMGGAAGGDIASSVAVAHLAEIDDTHQAEELLPLLRNAVNDAHDELIERSAESKELEGLGTTCIAILRTTNKMAMVHVGDSRAYLLRKGKLAQITRDHTLVQYLLDRGQITPEEAQNHPKRNVIMRNVGDTPEPVELDESIREAVIGDRWLLCSDGLFGVVTDETIEETLNSYEDLDECGERLVELALAGGAPDNVTVVLADVVETSRVKGYDRGPIVVGSAAVDARRPSRAGSSAAGKAAALTARTENDEPEETKDSSENAPRLAARIAAGIAVAALTVAALGGGYAWTQTRYYVAPNEGNVAIYRGIPQDLGPFSLSSLHEETSVAIDDLSPVAQQRLETPITRGSLDEAERVVANLEQQKQPEPRPQPSPSPSATPSTFPGTSPSPTDDESRSGTPSPSPSDTRSTSEDDDG